MENESIVCWRSMPDITVFGTEFPVCCRYNALNFLQNPHERHPIAPPLGQGMVCLLWVQILPQSLVMHAVFCYILLCYNGTQVDTTVYGKNLPCTETLTSNLHFHYIFTPELTVLLISTSGFYIEKVNPNSVNYLWPGDA